MFHDEPARPDDDREGLSTGANSYLSRRDAKIIVVGLAALAILLYPVYLSLKAYRDQYLCGLNFKAMSEAMSAYMSENDERLPPTYATQGDSNRPYLDDRGYPYTWASTIVNLTGYDTKRSFLCPTALPSETMLAEGAGSASMGMDYGMYAALGGLARSDLSDPGRTIVVAETSNAGANGTFDPVPLPPSADGTSRDGFLIGWSTGDLAVPKGDGPPPPSVTRLAFPGSRRGLTAGLDRGRHGDGIFALFADGRYRLMRARMLLDPRFWPIPTKY